MRVVVNAGEQLLHKMLARFGFEVLIAYDGNQALDYFLMENPPKIGILNWEMEGMGASKCLQNSKKRTHRTLRLHDSTNQRFAER